MGDLTYGMPHIGGLCTENCKHRDTEVCDTCFKIHGKYCNFEEAEDENIR